MRHHIILVLIIAVAVLSAAVGCTGASGRAESNLADAEQALAYGRIGEAQSLSDLLDADVNGGVLTVNQLGRLSIVHMKLNEAYVTDENDNVAKALACYRAAFEVNPDSARAFYAECQVDDVPYCMTLATLVQNIDEPMEWPEEEPDSIPM
ncbi:MAG: hypothetical protein K2H98_07175 [Duncaniella sp.]|nr:hypothetical protein [Duncaniella sp.]